MSNDINLADLYTVKAVIKAWEYHCVDCILDDGGKKPSMPLEEWRGKLAYQILSTLAPPIRPMYLDDYQCPQTQNMLGPEDMFEEQS